MKNRTGSCEEASPIVLQKDCPIGRPILRLVGIDGDTSPVLRTLELHFASNERE